MMDHTNRAIGGYFELELGHRGRELYPQAMPLQSARAALLAILQAGRPSRVWIPWYICQALVDQAHAAHVDVMRYGLEEDFSVGDGVELASGDWLLYVNYFGLCDSQVDAVLARFPPERVIVDNSHAFFSTPRACLGTLYSPRKFVGVPDGGYLVASIDVPVPRDEDRASVWRCLPLLQRAAHGPEYGYAEFRHLQEGLGNQLPLQMSALSRRFLEAIDYGDVAQRRRANFEQLDSRLSRSNRFDLRSSAGAVPFAYPFVGGGESLRKSLIAKRIYVSQLWPELLDPLSGVPAFERFLANECLPLPCDQRYDGTDMDHVAQLVDDHCRS